MERDQFESVYSGAGLESENRWGGLTSADMEAGGAAYHQLLIDMLQESSRLASTEAEL